MKRCFEFRVLGHLPPKKDGATSMWGKGSERDRLIALRRAARVSVGTSMPLERDIRMFVEIHCLAAEISAAGDLDNFITGICDGLMAANGYPESEYWANPELSDVEPSRCVAIQDDREVREITARKVPLDSGEPWYLVTLIGE